LPEKVDLPTIRFFIQYLRLKLDLSRFLECFLGVLDKKGLEMSFFSKKAKEDLLFLPPLVTRFCKQQTTWR
jgi:hypothetical protein